MAQTKLERRIEDDFMSHDVGHRERNNMDTIRGFCRDTALIFARVCPEGRELSTALTRLEEAMFWADAAVARREPQSEE